MSDEDIREKITSKKERPLKIRRNRERKSLEYHYPEV